MQTDILESLDALSPECRHELKDQMKRVQVEGKRLKEQMRHLRMAERAEKEQVHQLRKAENAEKEQMRQMQKADYIEIRNGRHAPKQRAEVGRREGKKAFRRGGAFISAGPGYREGIMRGRRAARNAMGLRDQAADQLHRQRQEITQVLTTWKDDLVYLLLRQGQHFLQRLIDRREDAAHHLRKQGRNLSRNLADRREDVTWQLHKQRRQLGRTLYDQRVEATRQLRRKGREINRKIGEQRTLWSTIGFVTGLVLAGSAAYWMMKRMFRHKYEEEEQQIELPGRETMGGFGNNYSGEMRYTGQGGTALATRHTTYAEPTSRFVGVLSTRRCYPIERQSEIDARDLVYFKTEEDARAEGFNIGR